MIKLGTLDMQSSQSSDFYRENTFRINFYAQLNDLTEAERNHWVKRQKTPNTVVQITLPQKHFRGKLNGM